MAVSAEPSGSALTMAVFPEEEVRDSTYFVEQERLVKVELIELAQRQRRLQWTAQLYARRAKQLWTEEKLAELGLPPGHSLGLLDDSEAELPSDPATPAEVPAPSGGAKRREAAFSQQAGAVQKKRLREQPPPATPCIACWNLGRGKTQMVAHNAEQCPKSKWYKGKKAAAEQAAGGSAAEPAADVGDADEAEDID